MAKISEDELNKLIESDRKLRERYKKQNEYLMGKYDRLNFTVPAGKKADIEVAAKVAGVSLNTFCRDAVLKAVEKALQKQESEEDTPPFM